MELNAIQTQILKPFVDETIQSLESMAGLKATAGDGFPDDVENFRFKGYAVAAETSGVISGKILMHHYIETALEIGNKVRANLLGEEDEIYELDDEMRDALAEFGNTAIGLAMRELGQSDMGIKFTPPYFIGTTTEMTKLLDNVVEIISIPIHIENVGRFYFNYLLHEKTEA
jgi:CheY-specific phosphatase CheX